MPENIAAAVSEGLSLDVPQYYPIHRQIIHSLNSYNYADTSKDLKDLQKEILDSSQKYIDLSLELNKSRLDLTKLALSESDASVKKALETLQKLDQVRTQDDHTKNLVVKAKLDLHLRFREEDLLTFETLRSYQNYESGSDVPLQSGQLLKKLLDEPINNSVSTKIGQDEDINPADQLSIYIDPYAVIKDKRTSADGNEDDDEEELEISGGKVELRCPLSQQIIKKPIITSPCHHTFDHESLILHARELRSSIRTLPCPVCGRKIESYKEDKLMEIRLKLYERDQLLKG